MIKRLFTVLCGIFIFSCFFSSCQSTPVRFAEGIQKSSLSGKTVFLEISMAEWQRTYVPLLDAGIYNGGLDKIADEFNVSQKSKINSLQGELVELYASLYKPEIIIDSFPFKDDKYTLKYFTEKDKQTGKIDTNISETIAEICARHEAEYALAFIGQMQTVGVAVFGVNGRNRLVFEAALLDKSGNLVSSAFVQTEVEFIKSSDVNQFISLFDQAAVLLKNMINSMGM